MTPSAGRARLPDDALPPARPPREPRLALTPWLSILLLLTVLPMTPSFAATTDSADDSGADSGADSGRWTIDDVVRAEQASDAVLSRDGLRAAWVRSTVEAIEGEEKRIVHLFLAHLDGDEPRVLQLTRGRDRASSPRFSPDGRHLAFAFDRSIPGADDDVGDEQLWAIRIDGGEAFPVTRLDRSVRDFDWLDDDSLVVLAEEARSAWEREREKAKDTTEVVEDAEHTPPRRLYRVELEGGEPVRLTDNRDWIDRLWVAPDGSRALVRAQQSLSFEFDSRVPPAYRLLELPADDAANSGTTDDGAGVTEARLFEDAILRPNQVAWEADSSGFWFIDEYTSHPRYRTATVARLHHHDLAGDTGTRLVDLGSERANDRGVGRGFTPVPGGVVVLLADGVHDRPLLVLDAGGDAGWRHRALELGGAADGLTPRDPVASADGTRLVLRASSPTVPPQLYLVDLADLAAPTDPAELSTSGPSGDNEAAALPAVALTELNGSWSDKPKGRSEILTWTGAEGATIEGILHYPLDWTEGAGPRPLILDIHGGPASRDRFAWDLSWAAAGLLWRQEGAFLLQVNYHGSTGYGLEFVESIRERYYELELPDIEAGVDHVIARGLADPERLAVSGWSNGGILTAGLITTTDRYRAASVGAADVEWISDWANVDFGASFDNYYFGGPPWERLEHYVEKSPFFRLGEVTTPTIVYTGTEDRNVPPHQSWSLFRALQQLERAPTRLVLFPGEPHGLRRIPHQRRKIAEDLAWWKRHLFETPVEDRPAVRDGSPAAALLQRARAARTDGGVLGITIDTGDGPVPVPETVSFAGLRVGRFEVTRAQWAAFTGDAAAAPGREDHPAVGMGFDAARHYAEWLTESTGEAWRLPTEEEAERLARAARGDGNTLDRWAGYPPNPEDAEALRRAIAEGPGLESLLLPVGSLPGTGEDPVFDLDGNAAEWTIGEDGAGVATGPSAERARDPRGDGGAPDPALIGLRVIRDDGPVEG